MLSRYAGMTFEQFAGEPEIDDGIVVEPKPPKVDAERIPLFADITVAHRDKRSDAYRGDEWVGMFYLRFVDGNSRTWVCEHMRGEYAGSNIAEELIFAVCCRTGEVVHSVRRTSRNHRLLRRVFDRIKRTIGEAT